MNAKIEFFKKTLYDGIRDILDRQRSIAQIKLSQASGSGATTHGRSGMIMQALSQSPRIDQIGDGVRTELTYPMYIRFVDMKKYGNYRIYNRPIWGTLYGDTIKELKYGFREWLRTNMTENLTNTLNNT